MHWSIHNTVYTTTNLNQTWASLNSDENLTVAESLKPGIPLWVFLLTGKQLWVLQVSSSAIHSFIHCGWWCSVADGSHHYPGRDESWAEVGWWWLQAVVIYPSDKLVHQTSALSEVDIFKLLSPSHQQHMSCSGNVLFSKKNLIHLMPWPRQNNQNSYIPAINCHQRNKYHKFNSFSERWSVECTHWQRSD